MDAYFTISDFQPAPRHGNDPPLEGLEVDGRLVAVAPFVELKPRDFLGPHRPELFVNAVFYGLAQSTNLIGHPASSPR